MNEPTREDSDLREMREEMPRWLRVLMELVVEPLIEVYFTLEGFVRTRWEIVPADELPAVRERGNSTWMSREQVIEWIEKRGGFLCEDCKMELEPERQEADEIFPDVWEVKKYARCEACDADREHCCRVHHGYLLFRQDGHWMAIVPRVPFLRRCWLRLFG
jgi:hypothetical protein